MIFSLAYLTYPVIFAIDRANFDILIFVLLSLSVLFYQRNNFILSVIFLSLTIAMKGYSAILLAIFLFDRRYKELLLAAILVSALTFGSLMFFKDGMWIELSKMLISFQRANGIAFDMGSLICLILRFTSSCCIC